MELYKILDSVITTMWNNPCKIAIFTDGVQCKVFQKDFGSWWRNTNMERYRTPQNIESLVHRINADAKRLDKLVSRVNDAAKQVDEFSDHVDKLDDRVDKLAERIDRLVRLQKQSTDSCK